MRGVLLAAVLLVGCGQGTSDGTVGDDPSGGAGGAPGAAGAAVAGNDVGGNANEPTGGSDAAAGSGALGGASGGKAGVAGSHSGEGGKPPSGGSHQGGSASGGMSGSSGSGGAAGSGGGNNQAVLWDTTQTVDVLVPNGAETRASFKLSGPSCSAATASEWRVTDQLVGAQTLPLQEADAACFTKLTCERQMKFAWSACENPPTCTLETAPGFWDSMNPNCDGVGPDLADYRLDAFRLTVISVTFDPYDASAKIAHIKQKWELLGTAL